MTSPAPLVSVVIPTYNRGACIRRAVESVFAQSYGAWELVVVDDGSTDETRSSLAGFPQPRMRMLCEPHCGNPGKVRNRALSVARGYYIAFLDSDDLWTPDKLTVQLEALVGCSQGRWSYTDFAMFDDSGRGVSHPPGFSWTPYSGRILPHLVSSEAVVHASTVLIERSLLFEVGGFDESLILCEDYDLWSRVSARADVCAVSARLSKIRRHGAWDPVSSAEMDDQWIRICRKVMAGTGSPAVQAACRKEIARRMLRLARYHSRSGSHGLAARMLARSWRDAPNHIRWCVEAGKALARFLRPRRA